MRKNVAGIGIGAIVLIGLGLFYFIFVTGASEPALSDNVVAPAEGTLEGDWAVEKSSLEDNSQDIFADGFNQTFAGYRVAITGPATEAVGRTTEVSGGVSVRDGLVSADISIDTESFFSQFELQDEAFAEAIKAEDFPTATFSLDNPIRVDDSMVQVRIVTTGTLSLAGVEESVEVTIEAQLVTDSETVREFSESERVLQVVISANVNFEDFGINDPSTDLVTSSDTGAIEALINFVPAEISTS